MQVKQKSNCSKNANALFKTKQLFLHLQVFNKHPRKSVMGTNSVGRVEAREPDLYLLLILFLSKHTSVVVLSTAFYTLLQLQPSHLKNKEFQEQLHDQNNRKQC